MKFLLCLLLVVTPLFSGRRLGDNRPSDFGLDAEAWQGLDNFKDISLTSVDGAKSSEQSQMGIGTMRIMEVGTSPVMMIGLFNTGTNLLWQLLEANLEGINFKSYGFWKHIDPEVIANEYPNDAAAMRKEGAVGLVITREPASWLQSMKKAPYDLGSCMNRQDWVVAECTIPKPNTAGSSNWGWGNGANEPRQYANIETVWNSYMSRYDRLSDYSLERSLIVRYEDVVLKTEEVVKQIAQLLNLQPKAQLEQKRDPSKKHGSANGRMEAMEKINSKSYLHLYSNGQLEQACQLLNQTAMHQHDYHDCDQRTVMA